MEFTHIYLNVQWSHSDDQYVTVMDCRESVYRCLIIGIRDWLTGMTVVLRRAISPLQQLQSWLSIVKQRVLSYRTLMLNLRERKEIYFTWTEDVWLIKYYFCHQQLVLSPLGQDEMNLTSNLDTFSHERLLKVCINVEGEIGGRLSTTNYL